MAQTWVLEPFPAIADGESPPSLPSSDAIMLEEENSI
jgi:hypothetical protein